MDNEQRIWWIVRRHERVGPYTRSELKELAGAGQLHAIDHIWKEGFATPVIAARVQGLLPESVLSSSPVMEGAAEETWHPLFADEEQGDELHLSAADAAVIATGMDSAAPVHSAKSLKSPVPPAVSVSSDLPGMERDPAKHAANLIRFFVFVLVLGAVLGLFFKSLPALWTPPLLVGGMGLLASLFYRVIVTGRVTESSTFGRRVDIEWDKQPIQFAFFFGLDLVWGGIAFLVLFIAGIELLEDEFGAHMPPGAQSLTQVRFGNANALALDAAGDLYVVDHQKDILRQLDLRNGWATLIGGNSRVFQMGFSDNSPHATNINNLGPVATGSDGNVYVLDSSDSGLTTVREVKPEVMTLFGPYTRGDGPAHFNALYIRDADHIFIAGAPGRLIRLTAQGTPGDSINLKAHDALGHDYLLQPLGLSMDLRGNFYIAAREGIYRVSPTGEVYALAVHDADKAVKDTAPLYGEPTGAIAVDGAANVYFADDNVLRWVDRQGHIHDLAGQRGVRVRHDGRAKAASFEGLQGLAVDNTHTLYAADVRSIRKIMPDGTVTTVAGLH